MTIDRDSPTRDVAHAALVAHIDQATCDVRKITRGNPLSDSQVAALAVARSNIAAAGVLRTAAERGLDPGELAAWADDIERAGNLAARIGFE